MPGCCKFFYKKIMKYLDNTKNIFTFAPANKGDTFGALVQLVRMPACHAGGHGFESRTHRTLMKQNQEKP